VHNTYAKPYWMVSKEFASVLEGVSYVEPYVVPLRNDQINEALALARKEFDFVIQTQVWGTNYTQPRMCASFNEESFRNAGFPEKFTDKSWLPLFDQQSAER